MPDNWFSGAVGVVVMCVASLAAAPHTRANIITARADSLFLASVFDSAVILYRQAATLERRAAAPRCDALGSNYNMVGVSYQQWGRFIEAQAVYDTARACYDSCGLADGVATVDMNRGIAFKSIGRFDSAAVCYQRALDFYRQANDSLNLSYLYANLAVLYRNWGRFGKALEYNHNGMVIDERRNNRAARTKKLNNLAGVYYSMGELDKAIEYQREAHEEAEAIGDEYHAAIILNNLATLLGENGQTKEALQRFAEARKGYTKTNDREGLAINMSCVGDVYTDMGTYPVALSWYERALAINRRMNSSQLIASQLANIGIVRWHQKAYGAATDSLRAAVALFDTLRLTAHGDGRRDYLSFQIDTYQWLVSSLLRGGHHAEAFDETERASTKYLSEQIGSDMAATPWRGIDAWRADLGRNAAVVCFTNVNAETPLVRFVITRDTVVGAELRTDSLLSALAPLCAGGGSHTSETTRGIRVVGRSSRGHDTLSLDRLIACLREQLADPGSDIGVAKALARGLGTLLLGGVQAIAPEVTELIIVPDGILGFVPFEVLIVKDGRYLVEDAVVRYAHSLRVLDLVNARAYGRRRKPLLALGGARYESGTKGGVIETPEQQAAVARLTRGLAHTGGAMNMAYAAAGLADWPDLPGSREEVETIGRIVRRAEVLRDDHVRESMVKQASRAGELRGYRMLHFATHGVVVPDLAELSALVLSPPAQPDSFDDGYLRMNEIAELDLRADLVTLSACETGLGQIYGGERVVGLTQAFLIAGANGLAASLWQVADRSTMKFMTGMYTLMDDKDLSCAEALTRMKRTFLQSPEAVDEMLAKRGIVVKGKQQSRTGDSYAHPFFWAPFVYYGR